MNIVLLLARVLLALVFFVAGLAKLADLDGSRQALRDFGVPALLATPFGVLLPLAELAVAVALLFATVAWWGALGALALMLLFVAGIGYNLARGRHPDCHCFGQLHSAPAGWSTLIRNLVLAVVAGVVVVFGRNTPQASVLDWLGSLSIAQRIEVLVGVLLLVLLIGEGWALLQILGQQGRLLLRLEALETGSSGASSTGVATAGVAGLAVGTPAPNFDLPTLSGETRTLQALLSLGKPVVLLFSDPGCGPCSTLLPEIGGWQRDYATKLVVAVISRGSAEANRPKASEYGLTHVLLQKEREVAETYQVSGTPSAVLIGRDGTIGSPLAQGADAIRALITSALNPIIPAQLALASVQSNGNGAKAASHPASPRIGEPAPEFSLPDLAGQTVQLSDFRGHSTLLLFWRPGCGFCQRMLTDLKAWEARQIEGAPRLLVISSESVESNSAMGLRSPVLLDQAGMSVGRLFGAMGTPMAILVDAEGKIASELAAGAPAVLALAGRGLDTATRA